MVIGIALTPMTRVIAMRARCDRTIRVEASVIKTIVTVRVIERDD